ncbi:hypothetical protein ACH0R5_004602, partial [Vibrio vulnificus]
LIGGILYSYYQALRIKWCALNWISGLVLGSLIAFYTPIFESDTHNFASKWGVTFVFSIVYMAIFYEWSFLNEHYNLGQWHSKIFSYSYHRTKFLSAKDATREAKSLFALLVITVGLVFFAWLYPSMSTWNNWFVGLCAASMGSYLCKEEFSAPTDKRQSVAFFGSLAVFVMIMLLFFVLSISGVSFSSENKNVAVFIITASSWFAFGLAGTVLTKLLKKIRNRVW